LAANGPAKRRTLPTSHKLQVTSYTLQVPQALGWQWGEGEGEGQDDGGAADGDVHEADDATVLAGAAACTEKAEAALQPREAAHTLLAQRLLGATKDLARGVDRAKQVQQYEEAARVRQLATAVAATLQADAAPPESPRLLMNY